MAVVLGELSNVLKWGRRKMKSRKTGSRSEGHQKFTSAALAVLINGLFSLVHITKMFVVLKVCS